MEHLSPYLEVQSLKELYKSHPHCCDFAPLVWMSDDDDPQFYHPKPLPRRFMCRQSQVLSYSTTIMCRLFSPHGSISPIFSFLLERISSMLLWYPERPPMEMLHQCQDQITNDHTDFFHANKPVMNLFNPWEIQPSKPLKPFLLRWKQKQIDDLDFFNGFYLKIV